MDSLGLQEKSKEASVQSTNLSMNVAQHLLLLMKEVTKQKVDPQTVNAACNCASQIINLIKVNAKALELKSK